MAERIYLAFDLGAESGRAMLGTLADGALTLSEQHRFANPTETIDGHLHWNLPKQWDELKIGLRKTAANCKSLAGIGVDTWGIDFGLIDSKGDVIGKPFMYRDSRTAGMMERAIERVGRQRIFESTGIQFMSINTIYQLLSMSESKSPALNEAKTMLFMPDLFNYLFTGVRKCEFSIASTSQMYDVRRGRWAAELLKDLGIPTSFLPEVVPTGSVIGSLKKDLAAECGVSGDVPVIAPGCHDTASAVAAVPAEGSDWCYISSGTWSLMGVELPEPIINQKSLRYNYTNEGGFGGSIRFLRNIMGLWLVQECRRFWKESGREYSYTELTKMAAEAKPFGAMLDPEYGPVGSPGEMPKKIEAFCCETKQSPPGSVGEFVRCCLESLALTYRRTLDGLEDILGRQIKVIHIVGGGTQNELLNQMTADACGRTVIAGPIEATAAGNILLQAIATGDVKSLAELRSIVRKSFPTKTYQPMNAAAWKTANERYANLVASRS